MNEIRALIEQLVAAGVDPIEAAEVVSRAAIHGAASAPAKRSAGAVRQERYRRNKASQVTNSDDNPSLSSPEGSFPTPLSPKPLQSIPPSPPKGGSSPAEIDLAFDVWDEIAAAHGLAAVRVRSNARRKRLGAVLRQHGIEAWREACRKVGASSFCRGETGRGSWRADLDFVMQDKSFARILEGHYDDRPDARGSPPSRPSKPDPFKAYAQELSDEQSRDSRSDFSNWDDAQGVPQLTIEYQRR